MPPRQNSKAVAAMEKKSAAQAIKDKEKQKKQDAEEAKDWKKGANLRSEKRSEDKASKADDAARKRQEKAALLANEEEIMGSSPKPKKSPANGNKKEKKKKKSDLNLLEDALVGNADKKAKEAKKKARLRKEREERLSAEKSKKLGNSEGNGDPLLANTDAMIGSAAEFTDVTGENILVGRKANQAIAAQSNGSGMEAALDALNINSTGKKDEHPEKRMKALHMAFEERMMPEMKEDYPGLRKAQYQQKIFALWKKSSENPMNWER